MTQVPDSRDNRQHFGSPGTPRGDGQSGSPQLCLVTLTVLRSHLLAAVRFGPCTYSEHLYALDMWPLVPDDSLCIVDRNFLNADILVPLARDGHNRHWLVRAKSNSAWRTVQTLAEGDELAEMEVSWRTRQNDASLPMRFTARLLKLEREEKVVAHGRHYAPRPPG
jgi:hypothetical protein